VPVALLVFGVLGGIVVTGVIVLVAWFVLARRAAARRALLLEQLPPFLDSAMRVLSAGNTLEESIAAAARESPEPLRPLMSSVGRQVRLGAPIEAVLMEAGDINRLRDIKVMALAAGINRKFGGSMKNILRSLIQTIRQRDVAARELRALTAETRFSAIVLSIIPASLSIYIYLKNPKYYHDMWVDPVGRWLLVVSILMQFIGVFLIMRMMATTSEGDA
ncbi:MAG TPA: type II secretion system F family protein, partial [Nevskiaceae bacterium]|nr:type II secretion system F family protein [Nevskiaceae bacterium]